MNGPDIQGALASMSVICDTREQQTKRALSRYKAMGLSVSRAPLDYGDYTYNAVLPNGSHIYDTSGRVYPAVAVERKMDIDELAECFTRSRKRFEREFVRAQEHGARLYVLVENGSLSDIMHHHYMSRMAPKALFASVMAFSARYGAQFVFCPERDTGAVIREILRMELRQRLENGDYDEDRIYTSE